MECRHPSDRYAIIKHAFAVIKGHIIIKDVVIMTGLLIVSISDFSLAFS